MTCQDFLAGYSEYLDERLDVGDAARWRGHIGVCVSCARYDRVMRRGLDLVRDLPVPEPSSDFHMALRYRLGRAGEGVSARDGRGSGSTAAVPLAIAAMIAGLAWSPLLRPVVVPSEAPVAEAADSPEPATQAGDGAPATPPAGGLAARTPATVSASLPEGSSGQAGDAAEPFGAAPVTEPRIVVGPAAAPVWSASRPDERQLSTLSSAPPPVRVVRGPIEGVPGAAPDWSFSHRKLWPQPHRRVPTLWEGPSPFEAWRRSAPARTIQQDPGSGVLLLEFRTEPRGLLRLP